MRATQLLHISTDDALARRAMHGDDDAFALLYDRYRVRLEAYCRGIVRHEEDARDAAQSALAAAYQALRRGTEPRAVRPWLFRIAHNEAITVLRRRGVADELPAELPARVAGPGDALELREELTAVLAAVRTLAPGARSALLLRELGELSYPEVAQVLGTTPAGARQAVFEARSALQADRAGRGSDCDAIRRELSAHDGRRRQARHIRGHLRGCDACRDWSRAQRQRRQRLAIGGIPLPFTGWLAAAFGGAAGAGGGAALTGGLAVQAQLAAATIILVAGAAPVVAPRVAREAPPTDPPAETATRAANLTTSGGPARLVVATAATTPVARPASLVRAATTRSEAAEDPGRRAGPAGPGEVMPGDRRGRGLRFAADRPRWDDEGEPGPRPPRGERRRDRWDADGREGRRDRERFADGDPAWRPPRERPAAVEAARPERPPADRPPAEEGEPAPVVPAEPVAPVEPPAPEEPLAPQGAPAPEAG
jgi:RNA polymerase sigma factor (sigma-70 family)